MRTPAETLDRLDMHWIPQPVRSAVRQTMVDATTNGDLRIPLTEAWRSAESQNGEGLYLQELRRRVVRAVAHALHRQEALPDATFLDDLSGEAIQHNEGPSATHDISAITTPMEMRKFVHSLGLPGDWYRNRFWQMTLSISQRSSVEPALHTMINMQLADPRFSKNNDMKPWMEGSPKRQNPEGDVKQLVRRALRKSADSEYIECPAKRLQFMRTADSMLDEEDAAILLPFSHDTRGLWRLLSSRVSVAEGVQLTDEELGRVHDAVDTLSYNDHLTWCQRIHTCHVPGDFQALFTLLELWPNQWKDTAWLTAHDGTSDTPHICFADLHFAIAMRFGSYEEFIGWMEGRSGDRTVMLQRIRTCETAEELQVVAHDLGISGEYWKSEAWLLTRSGLPENVGGVGKDLSWFAEAVANMPVRCISAGEPSFKGTVHRMLRGITHSGHAWDIVYGHCEEFGMSLDELLRTDQKGRIRKYPALQQAMDFLAESPNGEEF